MRRLLPLLALLLAACPRAPEGPPPGETPDAGLPDAGPGGIQGTLTIHLNNWVRLPQEVVQSVYVILGDGSRFRQAVDAQGNVRFQDAAIVGPQDVSVVLTVKSDTPSVVVGTILAIDQPEVWLPFVEYEPTSGPPPSPPKLATISGKVSGVTGTHLVDVFVAGEGFSGGGRVAADGTFRFDVLGAEPGQVDLIVREEDYSYERNDLYLLRTGRLRDIAVGRDAVISGLALSFDHAVDQSLGLTVDGLQHYGSPANVSLTFHEGDLGFFSTFATGTSPLSVPTLAMTAPFDTTHRLVSTWLGSAETLPGGYARALTPIGNGPAATVTLLSPMATTSPALGTCATPSTASRSGLVLRWNIDAVANMGQLVIQSQSPGGAVLNWSVTTPSSITSFTPFPLPAEVSPVSAFPAGRYSVELKSSFRGDVHDYASLFARDVTKTPRVEERETRMTGCIELQ